MCDKSFDFQKLVMVRGKASLLLLSWCFSSGGCDTDVTARERAISNGQRSLGSFPLLYLSYILLKILAVFKNAVFCSNPVLIVIPDSLSSHVFNPWLTTPRAPTTAGTTNSCCLITHSLPISLFKSYYLSIFSPTFSYFLFFILPTICTIIALLLSPFEQEQCQVFWPW